MAKVASKALWWTPVTDAAQYAVRVVADGTPFDYDTTPELVVPAGEHVAEDGNVEVSLQDLELAEGTYTIYITALDAAGNESDPLDLPGSVLDFTPPAQPERGGLRS